MRTTRTSKIYGNNVINPALAFEEVVTWNVVSGTGSAATDNNTSFDEFRSLKVSNTDVANPITVNYNATDIGTTVSSSGTYLFSYYVKNDTNEQLTGSFRLYKNTVVEKVINFDVEITDEDIWIGFFDSITLAKGDKVTYDITLDANPTSLLASNTVNIDGVGLYLNDRNMLFPPTYTKPLDPNSGAIESFGVYDYNDLNTQTTPIALTLANTQYELTNDGLGAFTNKTYALTGLPDVWDTSTNRFEFTNGSLLTLGDTVDIRFDVEVTTSSVNTAVAMFLELGVGGSSYQLPLIPSNNFKTAGTYELIRWFSVYMGDSNTLDNPARVLMEADSTGVTVKVNGWYCRPMQRLLK